MMKKRNNKGFTLTELLMSLAIVSVLSSVIVGYYIINNNKLNSQMMVNNSYYLAQASTRYVVANSSQLKTDLSSTNVNFMNVSLSHLKKEGFVPTNFEYTNSYGQIPCLVIWLQESQLNSMLYFRASNGSRAQDLSTLYAAYKQLGNVVNFFKSNAIYSPSGNPFVNLSADSQFLVSKGYIPSEGDSSDYVCQGNDGVADGSLLFDVNSMISQISHSLPSDTNLSQDTDNLNSMMSPSKNKNMMESDLIIGVGDNQIIFQMNPSCPPSQANCIGKDSKSPFAGTQQLGMVSNNNQISISGFNLSYAAQKSLVNPAQYPQEYVGGIQLNNIQPLQQIPIGTPCQINEIAKMAQQPQTNDINSLYASQVQCMQSPICSNNGNTCYLPVTPITVTINFATSRKVIGYQAPPGFYVQSYTNIYPTPNMVQPNQTNDTSPEACSSTECSNGVTCNSNGSDFGGGGWCSCEKHYSCGPFGSLSDGWVTGWWSKDTSRSETFSGTGLVGQLTDIGYGRGSVLTEDNWDFNSDSQSNISTNDYVYNSAGVPVAIRPKFKFFFGNEKQRDTCQDDHTCYSFANRTARSPYFITSVTITNDLSGYYTSN